MSSLNWIAKKGCEHRDIVYMHSSDLVRTTGLEHDHGQHLKPDLYELIVMMECSCFIQYSGHHKKRCTYWGESIYPLGWK